MGSPLFVPFSGRFTYCADSAKHYLGVRLLAIHLTATNEHVIEYLSQLYIRKCCRYTVMLYSLIKPSSD